MIALGTYMKAYKVGDIVDIKANGAVQKGVRTKSNILLQPKPPESIHLHKKRRVKENKNFSHEEE